MTEARVSRGRLFEERIITDRVPDERPFGSEPILCPILYSRSVVESWVFSSGPLLFLSYST